MFQNMLLLRKIVFLFYFSDIKRDLERMTSCFSYVPVAIVKTKGVMEAAILKCSTE